VYHNRETESSKICVYTLYRLFWTAALVTYVGLGVSEAHFNSALQGRSKGSVK